MGYPILSRSHPGVPQDRDGTKFFFMGWDGTKSLWDGSSRSRPGSMPGPGWDKVLVGWELPSRSHGQPMHKQKHCFKNLFKLCECFSNFLCKCKESDLLTHLAFLEQVDKQFS